MRHKVQVHQTIASSTENVMGELTYGTNTLATLWSSITPLRGRELVEATQIVAEATHSVTIRGTAGIGPGMWLTGEHLGSRRLDIVFVRDLDERGAVMELLCQERVPE